MTILPLSLSLNFYKQVHSFGSLIEANNIGCLLSFCRARRFSKIGRTFGILVTPYPRSGDLRFIYIYISFAKIRARAVVETISSERRDTFTRGKHVILDSVAGSCN